MTINYMQLLRQCKEDLKRLNPSMVASKQPQIEFVRTKRMGVYVELQNVFSGVVKAYKYTENGFVSCKSL